MIGRLTLLAVACAAGMSLAESTRAADLRVAFVVSEGFNMMDFAGPWEVFQDANGGDAYQLYTVSAKTGPVHSTGGAQFTPRYGVDDAPHADIVVIGAQSDASPEILNWIKAQRAAGATVMSVCTGASKLARSGLLDGHRATTHHEFLAEFKNRYPAVEWVGSRRYVRADDRLYTAGGLTSGIDLALYLVAQRFGTQVAQATADYMEYHSDGWKQAAE